MSDQHSDAVAYRGKVRIERVRGPYRRAYLPVEDQPIEFGVHSEIAEHYGVSMTDHDPHSTTLDYLIAAAGG